jgi:hypothetical protein
MQHSAVCLAGVRCVVRELVIGGSFDTTAAVSVETIELCGCDINFPPLTCVRVALPTHNFTQNFCQRKTAVDCAADERGVPRTR